MRRNNAKTTESFLCTHFFRWGLLIAFMGTAGCNPIPFIPALPTEGPEVATKAPPDGYISLDTLTVVNGYGCGLLGELGDYDLAYEELLRQATNHEARYLYVFEKQEPHREETCYDNRYILRGVVYTGTPKPTAVQDAERQRSTFWGYSAAEEMIGSGYQMIIFGDGLGYVYHTCWQGMEGSVFPCPSKKDAIVTQFRLSEGALMELDEVYGGDRFVQYPTRVTEAHVVHDGGTGELYRSDGSSCHYVIPSGTLEYGLQYGNVLKTIRRIDDVAGELHKLGRPVSVERFVRELVQRRASSALRPDDRCQESLYNAVAIPLYFQGYTGPNVRQLMPSSPVE